MPLRTDPDTLRIPAFMRKRSINRRVKRPLPMTALDRKKAGVLLEELKKKRRERIAKKILSTRVRSAYSARTQSAHFAQTSSARTRRRKTKTAETFSAPLLDLFEMQKTAPRKIRKSKQTFSMPILETESPEPAQTKIRRKKEKKIGKITHYYDKIKVAVIKLSSALSVDDLITYETAGGHYEQVVESMEINREPVFKAVRGDDIGLKLKKEPRIGCTVTTI